MIYQPDSWVVLKIKPSNDVFPIYKVLAGWSGGYLDGDSWRLNSGITGCYMEKDGDYYYFTGFSGSVYRCHKDSYRLTMANGGAYNSIKKLEAFDGQITLMPEDTNWMEIEYE